VIFFPFFLGFFALWAFAFVFWIVKIVEVAGIPDYQYKAARTEKLAWILVVVLAGIIGAIIWQYAKREQVLAMTGAVPPSPPGWYPDPGNDGLRWWDGSRWTEHRNPGSPPA
jgi:hypothetical protein